MPPKKIYPQKWPLYDGHNTKAVKCLGNIDLNFVSEINILPLQSRTPGRPINRTPAIRVFVGIFY
jgi:hypothetical protein